MSALLTPVAILTLGNARLRAPAQAVTRFDSELVHLLELMRVSMRAAEGIGLAANQIGDPRAVAIVEHDGQLIELINPRRTAGHGYQAGSEGCLSLPGFVAELVRPAELTVEAHNRRGRRYHLHAHGLLARALAHELDHLAGRLYIDHLDSLDQLYRSAPLAPSEV